MTVVGLMPVRNESWVLNLTLRAALLWMDKLVILNHASTDSTPQILDSFAREFKGRIIILEEPDPEWREMNHRQWLLEEGRRQGGNVFATVDADELLTGNLVEDIHLGLRRLEPGQVLQLPWICLWRDLRSYRQDDSIWSRSWATTAFRDHPDLHWRPRTDGYQHHHRHPMGANENWFRPARRSQGGLMHLQFVCWRRLCAKQALYKMNEVLRWPNREPVDVVDSKYSRAVDETGIRTQPVPDVWWPRYSEWMPYVDLEQPPWQEEETRKLWRRYGPDAFRGLDLFGVLK